MSYRGSASAPAPLLLVATKVTALDRENGNVLWEYSQLHLGARRFSVHEHWVIVLDAAGQLHCVELRGGRQAGFVRTGLSDAGAFLFDGERFYVSNETIVVALDWNGVELWRRPVAFYGVSGLGGMAVGEQSMQPDFSRS